MRSLLGNKAKNGEDGEDKVEETYNFDAACFDSC